MMTCHSVSSGFVRGGDRRAVHARPAGLARLREAVNSGLEETSSRTALAACAAALLLTVAAIAIALLVSGHGTVADAEPQRSGGNGRNVRRDADGFAAAARDRGPFSIPGDA